MQWIFNLISLAVFEIIVYVYNVIISSIESSFTFTKKEMLNCGLNKVGEAW